MRLTLSRLAAAALVASLPAFAPADDAPLHRRIDRAIAAGKPDFVKHAAPRAGDAEFLRRATLDLTGTVPTAAEARAFLDDTSPGKRAALIDRLLAGPEHARHMAHVFDVMLMERRPDKNVPRADWLEYLRGSFAADKPWDAMAREMLSGDGTAPAARPPLKFLLDRDAEPHLVTRDVGRLFLGLNLQCAQCHDHPLVDDYKQDHYYGIFAFVNRTSLFNDKALKLNVLAEKADGEASFQSVFDKDKKTHTSPPKVPGGAAVKEPTPEKGKEYAVAPAKDVRPVPAFSRRAQLAAQVTAADNVAFRRNIANRLWAHLMGRGLVHPLDMDHAANPPSHPELLELLADDVAACKFDVRGFLRELALSETYQRSSEAPADLAEPETNGYRMALLKPLPSESLAAALLQATGFTDAERKALGPKATEAALAAKLAPAAAPVVRAFAGEPGTVPGFDPSLDQALFLRNGPTVRGWLAPRAGNLTDRLAALPDAAAVADELYLSVLTRRPTAEEAKDVAAFLASGKDRAAALQDMAWALLASAEFRFNH